MSITKLVLKHSIAIIIIWIVLITISTPALFKLEEVTQYRAERLLPSGVESDRAINELIKISNKTGKTGTYELIIITGINATDPELLSVDSEISSNIESYVSNYNSPYKIIREVFRDIDRNIYNTSISIYNKINQTLYFLEFMHSNGKTIINYINNTHMFLIITCKYYDEFDKNWTDEIADQLYRNLSMIPIIYNFTSTLYNNTVNQLNTAKELFEKSINIVSSNYTTMLYDLIRIHYYLLHNTTAYQYGLNKTIIDNIINYTKLSNYTVDEYLINETYYYVINRGFENISINELSNLAINILIEHYSEKYRGILYSFTTTFLNKYSTIYLNTLETRNWTLNYFFKILNRDPYYGQIELLNNLIELNNTIYFTTLDEYIQEATVITKNYLGFINGSEVYIEDYIRNKISLNEASREITKLIVTTITGLKETSFIVDIVYKYNGIYTYGALYDLIYTMTQYIDISKFFVKNIDLSIVSQNYLNKIQSSLVNLLTTRVWYRNLSKEYIYRLITGLPIVIFTIILSNNSVLIDNILYYSEIINSVIDNKYIPGNYSPIINTLVFIVSNTGFNIFNNTYFPTFLLTNNVLNYTEATLILIRELINIPTNASTRDYIELLINAILSISSVPLDFPKSDLVDLLNRVISGDKPIDVIVNYTSTHLPTSFEPEVFNKYLYQSLLYKNYSILYIGLRNHVLQSIFTDFIKKFINVFVSEKYNAFIITIYPLGNNLSERVSNAYKTMDIVKEILNKHGFKPEYIGIIGDSVLEYEMTMYTRRDMSRVQLISIIAPVIIALVLIGGLLATIVPFIGIATSLSVSSGLIYLLASMKIITFTSWSRVLLITTSFGLGMDYTSYIILRFKEKYPEIRNKKEAVYEAVKYALPAIIASSSTDIIGFAVMKLAWEFPLIASLGETVPLAILIVLLVSITFTPALLLLFGDKKWFWWPHNISKPVKRLWRGFELTKNRAYLLLLLTIVIISVGFIGFTKFKGSHDYSVFIPEDAVSYRSYIEFQKHFPSGKFLPIYAVFILRENYGVYDEAVTSDLVRIVRNITDKTGVSNVFSFLNPGDREPGSYVSLDNKSFYIEIVLNIQPLSREGIDLVREIKNYLHSLNYNWISEVLVGGLPASSCEIEELLNNVFWTRVFPVAFILMWICMTLSFNSVFVGLIALVTILTGYLFGVATAVYIAELHNQPLLWFLTLLVLPAILGVGLDYNSFYMNRQRYEIKTGHSSYEASTIAIHTVSHLVIGLGLIVTATYGGIATGSSWGLREIGIALSTSVFVTTILSSIIFTPAALALMNNKAWWPGSNRWRK